MCRVLLTFLAFPILLQGQMMLDVPLQQRLEVSDVVCEGRIIHKQSFEVENGDIYTKYFLDVSRVFKGDTEEGIVAFTVLGGVTGDRALEVCPGFELPHGSTGVIMLRAEEGSSESLRPTAVQQSWLEYDMHTGDVLDTKGKITTLDRFVPMMEEWLQRPSRMVRPIGFAQGSGHAEMITVSTLSPSTIPAGRGQELVITGTGFGSTQGVGEVLFRNVNGGTTSFSIAGVVYTSWSDTEIRVLVPENAGSGAVRIQNNVGQLLTTTQQLTIPYNINNILDQETRMVDDESDGNGGYTFVYSTSTANNGVDFTSIPAAVAAVERAVNTWTGGTSWGGYGEEECGTSTVQAPGRDGVNLITFDNDLYDLDSRSFAILGEMRTYLSRCGGSWEIVDLDMTLRRDGNPNGYGGSVNWEYGPSSPSTGETDFESVVLHEFGHAHGLGHTAVSSAVMFRSIVVGSTNRNLRPEETTGGGYMQTESLGYSASCENDYTGYDPGERCSLVLPLDLISFQAEGMKGRALVSWTSQNEVDHDAYILEWLKDGQWIPINTQDADGNDLPGSYDYEFLHKGLNKGIYTYRLRMVSIDGHIEYSQLVSCEVDGKEGLDWQLKGRDLSVFSNIDKDIRIDVIDLNGRVVMSRNFSSGQKGGNVSLEALKTGAYFLRMAPSTGQSEVVKVVL